VTSRIVIFVIAVVIIGLLIWIRRKSSRNEDRFIGEEYDSEYDDDHSDFSGNDIDVDES